MNNLKYLLCALVLLGFASCKDDPWDDVADGRWNHDRTIVGIKFEGQTGTSTITNIDATTGEVEFQLAVDLVPDMSKVKVEQLTLSYEAEGSVTVGDAVDFTKPDPTIVVTAASGETRAYLLKMERFEESLVGYYAISASWVYGGTGPSYGGAALMAPEKKSWCWDENGYGPAAEYDDYLEFRLDEIGADGNTRGTCVHYGGVDKKHWNCMYEADQNKEGTTAVDLHRFYRQIPVGTSKWERNYSNNTLTFTDANGKKTSGVFIESAGSYDVGDGKAVEVEDHAFRFTLKGQDCWTSGIIYTDYDKFVKNPRVYFVLAAKVDAIPEASKTEGSEGATEPDPGPVDPDPDPDPDETESLAGTYAIDRLTVYGGTADPAFVDPLVKVGSWDETLSAEADNLLILTSTGTDSKGRETGTAEYTAGADGAYWSYIFKASANKDGTGDLDMTKYYGKLPHGTSTYTYDPQTGEIVFVKTSPMAIVSAKILTAGNYTYGVKELEVAGIAIDFKLDGETAKGKYPWTDYDRFVVGPYNYVMLFSKQAEADE